MQDLYNGAPQHLHKNLILRLEPQQPWLGTLLPHLAHEGIAALPRFLVLQHE